MKRFIIVSSLIAAMALTTQTAIAARVYNFLPIPVGIFKGLIMDPNEIIWLQPQQRSASISWTDAHEVGVYGGRGGGQVLCAVSFLSHAEIQGGNYMTIGHDGNTVVCTVCDSHQNTLASSQKSTGIELWDGKKYPASKVGCR